MLNIMFTHMKYSYDMYAIKQEKIIISNNELNYSTQNF